MIEVPSNGKILVYGPGMANVESYPVRQDEYRELAALREYMLKLMRKSNGIGLAAPQVGVFKQFMVMERADGTVMDLVNPEIVKMYGRELMNEEGCLSVPPAGNNCKVPRMEFVSVEYRTVENFGMPQEILFGQRDSAVAQHEIDHLTGTFFFDRVGRSQKSMVLSKLNDWKDKQRKVPHVQASTRPQPVSCQ